MLPEDYSRRLSYAQYTRPELRNDSQYLDRIASLMNACFTSMEFSASKMQEAVVKRTYLLLYKYRIGHRRFWYGAGCTKLR